MVVSAVTVLFSSIGGLVSSKTRFFHKVVLISGFSSLLLSFSFIPISSASADSIVSAHTDATYKIDEVSGMIHLKDGEKVLAVGKDTIVRTINTHDVENGLSGQLRNTLNLSEGDVLTISSDKRTVTLRDSNNNLLGSFESPRIDVDGTEQMGEFSIDGDYLITTLPAALRENRAYWRATAARWTWRLAGGLTCGAANAIIGGVCGLAWAGAEDHMHINK